VEVTTRAAEEVTVGRKGNTRSRRAQRGDQIERSRRSPARFRASQRFPSPAFKVRFQGSLSPLFSVVGSRHHVVTFSSCFPSGFDDLRARSEAQICGRETRTIAVERSRTPTSDVDRVHERVHHESPPPRPRLCENSLWNRNRAKRRTLFPSKTRHRRIGARARRATP
jgi:hypothetical protein